MSQGLTDVLVEWKCLEEEYQQLQETHRMYLQKLDEISKLQNNFSSSISHQRKRLKETSHLVKKFAYKDEYEKFKLCSTVILLLFSFICYFFANYRFFDAILNFLLVWYYCTLTIRESILITNGSRIKGWWVFHHYISAFLSGVMLTWPDGSLYKIFRNQFLAYSLYQSFVQCLQCYYQSGCLYRLRALGERHNMDVTVEGFQSWMWKGLTFLLPFLFFGHFWQLFNGLSLFRMAQLPDFKEWQVLMCGLCFLILFMGNFFTTVAVVRQKFKSRNQKPKSL
ncbi:ion channel TACAN-like isoform X3 [Xiphias gladius]|uniref:ion channel TACAN-like isoform X3 n=1 Tax=Xiphias gladius TaxID=8245 RepID=UPI001A97EC64|nr:ion channel TACAN-like isoform X3 [Xiphias gladius]